VTAASARCNIEQSTRPVLGFIGANEHTVFFVNDQSPASVVVGDVKSIPTQILSGFDMWKRVELEIVSFAALVSGDNSVVVRGASKKVNVSVLCVHAHLVFDEDYQHQHLALSQLQ